MLNLAYEDIPVWTQDNIFSAAHRAGFLKLINQSKASILGIVPYFAPCFSGENVRYFDIFSQDQLRENAKRDPDPVVNPDSIPQIHYHNSDGDMSGIPETFDIVFSSHCIEHQPDLVWHLQQVHDLLSPGGTYYILQPDKRFCFDHMRPETALGEVIQAAREKRRRHTLKTLVDHHMLQTHNHAHRHWAGDHTDPGWQDGQTAGLQKALDFYDGAEGSYLDAHAWQFTPARFLQTVVFLNTIGLTDMKPKCVWPTPADRHEFAAVLVRD